MGNDLVERLEELASEYDAEPEELTVAPEDDIVEAEELETVEAELDEAEEERDELSEDVEELEDTVEELETETEELESQLEEKESEIEEKESEISELQDSINDVTRFYAEELEQDSVMFDADDLVEKFDFEELQAKYDEWRDMQDDGQPRPRSGDRGVNFQNPEGEEGSEGSDFDSDEVLEELSADERNSIESMRRKGGEWEKIADEMLEDIAQELSE